MMSQIPDGCDPLEIYKRIESFLENLGYRGELNIWAYKGNNSIPDDEVISRFRDARINFKHDGTECIVVDTSEKGGHPKIGNALCDKHLLGVKVTVMAYGEKNQMFPECSDPGSRFLVGIVPAGGIYSKGFLIFLDMLFWALDNEYCEEKCPALMILSKDIYDESDFARVVIGLQNIHFDVRVSQPENVSSAVLLSKESYIWVWKCLTSL